MKVEAKQVAEAAAAEPKSKFCEVLKKATGRADAASPKGAKTAPAHQPKTASSSGKGKAHGSHVAATQPVAIAEARAAANKVVESLHSARKDMHAEAERLSDVRTNAQQHSEQKVEGRVLELIVNELKEEFGVPKPAPVSDQSTTQPMSKAEIAQVIGGPIKESKEVPRVEDIVKLVEQIRMFVKNSRPAMAMSVGGSLNAQVEIERTGPKQVSIKLVGKGALPKTQDINKIRESLAEKGIKVAAVEVAVRR